MRPSQADQAPYLFCVKFVHMELSACLSAPFRGIGGSSAFPPSSARVQPYLTALGWVPSCLPIVQGHAKNQNRTVTSLLSNVSTLSLPM